MGSRRQRSRHGASERRPIRSSNENRKMSYPMSKIEPARPLVLTTEQHALLGELVEIMGQVESMLIESVKHVDPGATGKLSKLTAGPQAKAWAKTIRGRVR